MKNKTWIVVASSTCARIFKRVDGAKLEEIETLVHPASRLHDCDLVEDRPGTGHDMAGTAKHAITPKTTPHKQEFADFAKQVGHHLDHARTIGSFDHLYLAANPGFLGLLRLELSKSTTELIARELNKDLVHCSASEISEHFAHN